MKTIHGIIIGVSIASVLIGIYVFSEIKNIERENNQEEWRDLREEVLTYTQNKTDSSEENAELLLCAQFFDTRYKEFLARPSCERPPPEPTCEPPSFAHAIRENRLFNDLSCPFNFDEWAYLSEYNDLVWQVLSPKYSFDVPKFNDASMPIPLTVTEYAYHMCTDFNVLIITHDERRDIIWKHEKTGFCIVESPAKWKEFTHELSTNARPLMLEPGDYYAVLYIGDMIEFDNLRSHDNEFEVDDLAKIYFGVRNEN